MTWCWTSASPSWKMAIAVPCSCSWPSAISICKSLLPIAKKTVLKGVMQEEVNKPLLFSFFLHSFWNILLDARYLVRNWYVLSYRVLMKVLLLVVWWNHDPKANWKSCLNTVADLILTACRGFVTHLAFGLKEFHHEFVCQRNALSKITGFWSKFLFGPSKSVASNWIDNWWIEIVKRST